MTMIEIILLLVGCVFMIGSFFISEKLSSSELNKIAELSEDELKKIIEREVNNAGTQMDEVIEQKIEEAGEQAEPWRKSLMNRSCRFMSTLKRLWNP